MNATVFELQKIAIILFPAHYVQNGNNSKGFIKAEVISYDDYVKYGSEAAARDAGRLRIEGKEYLVKDGDVMHFRFNV